jgi:hypothetical protein
MISAAAVLAIDPPKMEWPILSSHPGARDEVFLARRMIELNGVNSNRHFLIARIALIPIALVGTCACYYFGYQIFGVAPGLLAAFLWAFSPTVLAYGSVMTPDLASAVAMMGVAFAFHRWLALERWQDVVVLMFFLGIAMLVKSVWVLLPIALLIAWIAYRLFARKSSISESPVNPRSLTVGVAQLAVVYVGALAMVNSFYGFEGTFKQLGKFEFVSHLFTGAGDLSDSESLRIGNRFASTWLAALPVPLPQNYLTGIDAQRRDFEWGLSSPAWQSYLDGEWKQGGWWYFYLLGLFYKETLALWCMVALATAVFLFRRASSSSWLLLFALAVPCVLLIVLVSVNTGLNRYVRYALPLIPFLCVWSSQIAQGCEHLFAGSQNRSVANRAGAWMLYPRSVAAGLCSILLLGEVLLCGPHWLSHFNAVAGSSTNGYKHLCDSNVDWGQDLPSVQAWLKAHPEAQRTLRLAYFGSFDPVNFGIRFRLPPRLDLYSPDRSMVNTFISMIPDGWYVISKNYVVGHKMPVPDGTSRLTFEPLVEADFSYFSHLNSVDQIAGSMLVYHIGKAERETLRRALSSNKITESTLLKNSLSVSP